MPRPAVRCCPALPRRAMAPFSPGRRGELAAGEGPSHVRFVPAVHRLRVRGRTAGPCGSEGTSSWWTTGPESRTVSARPASSRRRSSRAVERATPSPRASAGRRPVVTPGPTGELLLARSQPAPTSTCAGSTATTLLAAGDIGRCDSTHDDATGALAASLPGVVATLGDTAYEDGTTQELNDCFGGSWGAGEGPHPVRGHRQPRHPHGQRRATAGVPGERGVTGRTDLVLGGPRGLARRRARRELRPPGSQLRRRLGPGAVAPRRPRRRAAPAARSR